MSRGTVATKIYGAEVGECCDCCHCNGEVTPPNTGRDGSAEHQYAGPYGVCTPNPFWLDDSTDSDWLGEPGAAPVGEHVWTLNIDTLYPGSCFEGRVLFDDTMSLYPGNPPTGPTADVATMTVDGEPVRYLTVAGGFAAWTEFRFVVPDPGTHEVRFPVINASGFPNPTGLRVEWYECGALPMMMAARRGSGRRTGRKSRVVRSVVPRKTLPLVRPDRCEHMLGRSEFKSGCAGMSCRHKCGLGLPAVPAAYCQTCPAYTPDEGAKWV